MNINRVLLIALFFGLFVACQSVQKDGPAEQEVLKPAFATGEVLQSFNVFWDYYHRNVKLYEDFAGYDPSGKTIAKKDFLDRLFTGKYFPLLLGSKDLKKLHYRLEDIPANADPNIGSYMRQFAADELKYVDMKGKPIPAFSFKDINGNLYTSANTKGKIVLFKGWFIGCVTCVQEMPALNQLVEKYKNRNDVLFISLALDAAPELKAFLAKTKFDYATVPNQEHYLGEQLRVNAYPAHFLINKEGLLVNVVSEESAIADLLDQEIGKD